MENRSGRRVPAVAAVVRVHSLTETDVARRAPRGNDKGAKDGNFLFSPQQTVDHGRTEVLRFSTVGSNETSQTNGLNRPRPTGNSLNKY